MKTKVALLMFVGALLASCSETSGILGTDVGRQMRNSNAPTPQLILRDAVFLQVKEQDAQQAVRTLENDGAVCSGLICRWTFIHRETWFDTWGARMPGPLRTWERRWVVTFLSEQILSKNNITTSIESDLVQ